MPNSVKIPIITNFNNISLSNSWIKICLRRRFRGCTPVNNLDQLDLELRVGLLIVIDTGRILSLDVGGILDLSGATWLDVGQEFVTFTGRWGLLRSTFLSFVLLSLLCSSDSFMDLDFLNCFKTKSFVKSLNRPDSVFLFSSGLLTLSVSLMLLLFSRRLWSRTKRSGWYPCQ